MALSTPHICELHIFAELGSTCSLTEQICAQLVMLRIVELSS
jgi:hypothetical protein